MNLKKYKNKKILLYGAGAFFRETVKKHDLSALNITGISDRCFETSNEKEFLGYRVVKPSEINNTDFDVILVSTFNTVSTIEHLETITRNRNVRIMPLLEKGFKELFEELY